MNSITKTVEIGTTAIQVHATAAQRARLVQVKALSSNSADIVLKYDDDVTVADSDGYTLEPGAYLSVYTSDLINLYGVSSASGQKISIHISN